jgi:glucose-1-phosphate thymidylyltransferase
MKGILLAGGTGKRLWPATRAVSKQLLPVYDKPMIFYPLSALMLAGVREILIVSTAEDQPAFMRLLGDGDELGLQLHYAVQPRPEGIAQAFVLARSFIDGQGAALALGDNIFYGHGLAELLQRAASRPHGATALAYQVRSPERYGVVELDGSGKPISLEEKPKRPRSRWAVTGLYFCDARACELASELEPSARGELEITDLLRRYLEAGELHIERLSRGFAWLDAGTPEWLVEASAFVRAVEQRQALKIACIEEVAYRMGYIDRAALQHLASTYGDGPYSDYLRSIADE